MANFLAIYDLATPLLTVAFAIKKRDSWPMHDTSGELFIIVFTRDTGKSHVV